MNSIVITGPESSGKTTLATQLADHFGVHWVPEFARAFIDSLDRPYRENDLLKIAKGQLAAEKKAMDGATGLVFLDTSLEVIKIWAIHKYGRCHPWILEQTAARKHDLYLLCGPDLPWQPDPQRENPNDRKEIFELYRQELAAHRYNFVEITGLNAQRLTNAIRHVESYVLIT